MSHTETKSSQLLVRIPICNLASPDRLVRYLASFLPTRESRRSINILDIAVGAGRKPSATTAPTALMRHGFAFLLLFGGL